MDKVGRVLVFCLTVYQSHHIDIDIESHQCGIKLSKIKMQDDRLHFSLHWCVWGLRASSVFQPSATARCSSSVFQLCVRGSAQCSGSDSSSPHTGRSHDFFEGYFNRSNGWFSRWPQKWESKLTRCLMRGNDDENTVKLLWLEPYFAYWQIYKNSSN